jgi:hypothetical protein
MPHFSARKVRVYFFDGYATEEVAPVIVTFAPCCFKAWISPDYFALRPHDAPHRLQHDNSLA